MSEVSISDRQLLAIPAADLVGYSALMARDQEAALAVIHDLGHQLPPTH